MCSCEDQVHTMAEYHAKGFETQDPVKSQSHARPGASRLCKVMLPLLWLLALGCSAASLGGVSKGWAYYKKDNFLYRPLGRAVTLKIWVGWVRGTDSIRQLLRARAPTRYSYYLYLRDVVGSNGDFGQVWGGITAAVLCLSIIAALACLVIWAASARSTAARPASKAVAWVSLACWFFVAAMSCVLYTIEAVAVSRHTQATLGGFKAVCWPDWAYWLAMIASLFWLISAAICFRESRSAASYASPTIPEGKHPQGAVV
ncbi:hypothetical protein WJX72_005663 [[Myrmecia] bisecta]|uniref:Uncharacterized protein n=1 Tax=[Myrmecia] bisecta TaxID=41462 RepID=A0AAW1Q4R4_9CHLO